jgi:DNA-binding winged helix-turn-helix (wHTH) protein
MNTDEIDVRQEEVALPPLGPVFRTRYLRFGEFELDLEREELWKDGRRIRLQGKVYQTLLLLLHRAGSVVTRDEVRRYLWPENPQVNVDANVNTSINKLRQALGDSPDKPLYIETIPRKGYCFLANVEFSDTLKSIPVKAFPTPAENARDAAPFDIDVPRPPHSLPMALRIATLVLAGMIVGALLVLAWFMHSRSH